MIEQWMPSAARRLGVTVARYAARFAAGERWCTACGGWHPKGDFDEDLSRRTGCSKTCRRSRQRPPRPPRAGPPTAQPSRSAWVAVDRTGTPVAVWPGRQNAEEAARTWIRHQERDDLEAVPLSALRKAEAQRAAA